MRRVYIAGQIYPPEPPPPPPPPPPPRSNWEHVLRGYRKPYSWSLDSQSDLALTPSYGSNWGHKIADFVFLHYISFSIVLQL